MNILGNPRLLLPHLISTHPPPSFCLKKKKKHNLFLTLGRFGGSNQQERGKIILVMIVIMNILTLDPKFPQYKTF